VHFIDSDLYLLKLARDRLGLGEQRTATLARFGPANFKTQAEGTSLTGGHHIN
jgi:hypothetical protein